MRGHAAEALHDRRDKGYRGDAAQFFVAAELCRRGLVAVVTLGNCPNTDILVSNAAGTRFVHVQVKTFVPGGRTCSVGKKAEIDGGEQFYWVLAGIPAPDSTGPFEYFVIPAKEISTNVRQNFELWAGAPGKQGQQRDRQQAVRTIRLPPGAEANGWTVAPYRDKWSLIESALRVPATR